MGVPVLLIVAVVFLLTRKREFLDPVAQSPTVPAAAPAPRPAEPAGTSVVSIMSLESEYTTLRDQYKAKVDQALAAKTAAEVNPLIEELVALNTRVTEALNKLIARMAQEEARGSTDFTAKRKELTRRLDEIQRQYKGLTSDTDRLRALRKIREYEETKTDDTVQGYMIAFSVFAALLIGAILFKRSSSQGETLQAITPMASTPTMTSSLDM